MFDLVVRGEQRGLAFIIHGQPVALGSGDGERLADFAAVGEPVGIHVVNAGILFFLDFFNDHLLERLAGTPAHAGGNEFSARSFLKESVPVSIFGGGAYLAPQAERVIETDVDQTFRRLGRRRFGGSAVVRLIGLGRGENARQTS